MISKHNNSQGIKQMMRFADCVTQPMRETPYHVIEECPRTEAHRAKLKRALERYAIIYPRLIDIVLDGEYIDPSLKNHKLSKTKHIDRERKEFFENIFNREATFSSN